MNAQSPVLQFGIATMTLVDELRGGGYLVKFSRCGSDVTTGLFSFRGGTRDLGQGNVSHSCEPDDLGFVSYTRLLETSSTRMPPTPVSNNTVPRALPSCSPHTQRTK